MCQSNKWLNFSSSSPHNSSCTTKLIFLRMAWPMLLLMLSCHSKNHRNHFQCECWLNVYLRSKKLRPMERKIVCNRHLLPFTHSLTHSPYTTSYKPQESFATNLCTNIISFPHSGSGDFNFFLLSVQPRPNALNDNNRASATRSTERNRLINIRGKVSRWNRFNV